MWRKRYFQPPLDGSLHYNYPAIFIQTNKRPDACRSGCRDRMDRWTERGKKDAAGYLRKDPIKAPNAPDRGAEPLTFPVRLELMSHDCVSSEIGEIRLAKVCNTALVCCSNAVETGARFVFPEEQGEIEPLLFMFGRYVTGSWFADSSRIVRRNKVKRGRQSSTSPARSVNRSEEAL
ncbi:hypothetical protein ABVT39_023738 [Epinephelus coioides]